jgi:hypothetical protein
MTKKTKKTSRLWSINELKKMAEIVELTIMSGKSKGDALQEAADYFGVTKNAVNIRHLRYKRGQSLTRVKRNTIKKPTKGIKRGPYKKKKKSLTFKEDKSPVVAALAKRTVAESNRIVLPISFLSVSVPKIEAIIVDFDARSITYTY